MNKCYRASKVHKNWFCLASDGVYIPSKFVVLFNYTINIHLMLSQHALTD